MKALPPNCPSARAPCLSQSVGQCQQTLSGSYEIPASFIKAALKMVSSNQHPCMPPESSWLLHVLSFVQKAEAERMIRASPWNAEGEKVERT